MLHQLAKLPAVAGFLVAAVLMLPATAGAEKRHENIFASIYLKDDKIGQIHYTAVFGPDGDVEELRTRASVSVFGIKLYAFTQDLHEVWRGGELQKLVGDTDDDGASYESRVSRTADGLDGELNGRPVDLPGNAFPDSIWHYQITEQTLLFNSVDLDLKKVQVSRSEETLELHGKKVQTERFQFTGDWKAVLWYDPDKQIVKARLNTAGREVDIVIDSRE